MRPTCWSKVLCAQCAFTACSHSPPTLTLHVRQSSRTIKIGERDHDETMGKIIGAAIGMTLVRGLADGTVALAQKLQHVPLITQP